MNIERRPVAYGDLRGWIKALHAAGEIKEVNAEIDWNIEIGTVMRLAQGTGEGPALLFNNIKDYGANARCRRIFGCGLSSYRRVAMMLGVAADTHPRELVKMGRNVLGSGIAPKVVAVLVAAGNREHPRPRLVAVAVRDTRAVAIVRNVPAEHRGKTELPFNLAQDQHAAIRRQLSTIKRCSDCFSADR